MAIAEVEKEQGEAIQSKDDPFDLSIVVVGHVDHGKSTVIGRLLADTGSLPEGKLEQLKALCARTARPFEYAFLMDALKNEQSQGITIDAARCFFKTGKRRYILNDAPGHIEFLKNMVTGAARAEAALLVIDAVEGVRENSRRHGYIVSMLGIRQLVVLVNKMDLVGYDRAAFDRVETEYRAFLSGLGVHPLRFIPISALEGENIARRSTDMAWYEGPTVLEQIDALGTEVSESSLPLRLPVQDVYKFTENQDERRIVAGTIETGSLGVGDEVIFLPSRKRSTIASIEVFNAEPPERAVAGQALGYTLTEQVYVRPGELMVRADQAPARVGSRFRANVFWMGHAPMVVGKRYKLKIGATRVPVELSRVVSVFDDSNQASVQIQSQVDRHDVAEVVLETVRPVAFDLAGEIEQTSRFVIVDGDLIAACGIVLEQLESGPVLLEQRVRQRESHWEKGLVSSLRRADTYHHRGKFIVFVGEENEPARSFARALELNQYEEGRHTYYLALHNILEELSERSSQRVMEREEQLNRLGDLARTMTDAGLLFITTLPGADEPDLERLRLLNEPYELFVVAVGDISLERFPVQVRLAQTTGVQEACEELDRALTDHGIMLDYEI